MGSTFDTEGYYKASDTAALTQAINDIFQKIVQTLGVTEVAIADGTTSNVSTGTSIAHLLEVDESSYQYWLTIPVTAGSGGTSTFIMPDKVTGDPVTYTVTPSGDNVIISWDGGSATYPGSVNLNTLTIEWTQATTFYNYTPPGAAFNGNTSSVDWNLRSVGTLMDNVTYTVTFDCYPSQETLDLIADLKNGDIEYASLPSAIRQYLEQDSSGAVIDYTLKTNTTATLTYTDTRPGGGAGSVTYDNPDPEPVNAAEEIAVSKIWSNTLDSREGWKQDIELYVTRDGQVVHTIELSRDNTWTNTAWISYGIISVNGNNVRLRTTGHEYSFSEDVETGYYWEIKAPTVRPMLINEVITMLKLIDEADAPAAIKNAAADNAKAEVGDDTYYKLTIGGEVKYYVVIPDISAALQAVNHRRSYLDVVKQVTGGDDVPEDTVFPFTMTVNNANAENADPDDTNSDAWVWFSIWDPTQNATLKDPDVATASGIRWQLNNDNVVTTKPAASDFNGYFCVPSDTEITVQMQKGYSLRFLNLPEETTYTITEGDMPNDNFNFVSIVGTRSYDPDMDESTNDWISNEADPDTEVDGQSITGTIKRVETAYKVTVTNNYQAVNLQLEKVDQDGEPLDGSVFKLEKYVEATADQEAHWEVVDDQVKPSVETVVVENETGEGENSEDKVAVPYDLGSLTAGTYRLTETTAPTGYDFDDTPIMITVTKVDGNCTVTATRNGEEIDLESATSGVYTVYTMTVENKQVTRFIQFKKTTMNKETPLGGAEFTMVNGEDSIAVCCIMMMDRKTFIRLNWSGLMISVS